MPSEAPTFPFAELPKSSGYSVVRDAAREPVALGRGSWGETWKAFHHGLQCHAALKAIPLARLGDEACQERFLAELRQASLLRHPHLATVFPPARMASFVLYAREVAEGCNLGQYVRSRPPLSGREALRLTDRIASALEAAAAAGLHRASVTAGNVLVLEEDGACRVTLVDFGLASGGTEAAPDERSLVRSLGVLLQSLAESGAELPESAAVLFDPAATPPSSVVEFRRRLADLQSAPTQAPRRPPSVPKPVPAPPAAQPEEAFEGATLRELKPAPLVEGRLTIPRTFLAVAEPGVRLTLKGTGRESLALQAGDTFRIGRSRNCAFVARFLPRNEANDARTWRLSKVQCHARTEEGGMFLRDGDGGHASTNGSSLDRHALEVERPLPLERPGMIYLADDYPISVNPFPAEGGEELRIGNENLWKGPRGSRRPSVKGAVLFASDAEVGRAVTVWLFTEAAFTIGKVGELTFGTKNEPAGAFHYHRGCFWLECRAAGALALDTVSLHPGEIVPLASGQKLRWVGADSRIEIAAGMEK